MKLLRGDTVHVSVWLNNNKQTIQQQGLTIQQVQKMILSELKIVCKESSLRTIAKALDVKFRFNASKQNRINQHHKYLEWFKTLAQCMAQIHQDLGSKIPEGLVEIINYKPHREPK